MTSKLSAYELEVVRTLVPAECVHLLSCVDDMTSELRTSRARLAALELTPAERDDVVEICLSLSSRALLHERDHEPSDEGDPGQELAAEYRRKASTLRRLLAARETAEGTKGDKNE